MNVKKSAMVFISTFDDSSCATGVGVRIDRFGMTADRFDRCQEHLSAVKKP